MPENNYQPDFNLKNQIGRDQEKSIKTRKAAVILLAVMGVFFVGMGFYQMSSRIKRPFKISDAGSSSESSVEERYLSVLQTRDTDGDGLSDYDEINVYKTSPYLEDTDSDGLSDYEEVQNFSDPTCPKGTDCYGLNDNLSQASSTPIITLPEISSGTATSLGTDEEKIIDSIGTGEIDVAILRSMLISNGLKEEDVNQISDDELKAIYLQAVADKSQEAAESSSVE